LQSVFKDFDIIKNNKKLAKLIGVRLDYSKPNLAHFPGAV